MSPILKGVVASQITGRLSTNSFESIASATGGTGIDTITFNNIPATYKHLEIRYSARSAGGTNLDCSVLAMKFGNDAGAYYGRNISLGTTTGRSVGMEANANFADAGLAMGSSAASNVYVSGVLTIPDYRNTSIYKHWIGYAGASQGTNAREGLVWSSWGNYTANQNAITRIDLTVSSGNAFTADSVFALYGMKG